MGIHLHIDYCEEDGNIVEVNGRLVVGCINCMIADGKVYDCFWHFSHRLHHQL